MSSVAEVIIDKIVASIPKGKENAIKCKELSEKVGLSERRTKEIICAARRSGNSSIISGSSGYWISEDPEEVKQYYRMMRSRAISTFRTAKAARNILNDTPGQLSVTFMGRSLNEEE